MATKRIRYLTERPGAAGAPPRYFWQPSGELRALGWRPLRVPDNWRELYDPAQLEAAAIAAAQQRNAELDAWLAVRAASLAAGTSPTARPPATPVTLDQLIDAYQAAGYPRLKDKDPRAGEPLAAKTIAEYAKCLAVLSRWGGDKPFRAIRTGMLRQFYLDLRAVTPAKAAAVMRVAQIIFKFARFQDWRQDNPADRLGLAGALQAGIIWPRAAVADFVRMADILDRPSVGTAVLLNEWLGQREADILALPRNVLDPSGHMIRQRKTKAGVKLPIASVPPLLARIGDQLALYAAHAIEPTRLILSEETGRPYEADNFRHVFAAIRAALAKEAPRYRIDYLPAGREPDPDGGFSVATTELQFMYLRHTAVTRNAEAEVDKAGIAAITGHSLKTVDQILERYLIRTGALAIGAFNKRMAAEGGA